MSTWKPKSEWTDEEFKAYAKSCYQADWVEFKAELLAQEAADDVLIDRFIEAQVAKRPRDEAAVLADLAAFILGGEVR